MKELTSEVVRLRALLRELVEAIFPFRLDHALDPKKFQEFDRLATALDRAEAALKGKP